MPVVLIACFIINHAYFLIFLLCPQKFFTYFHNFLRFFFLRSQHSPNIVAVSSWGLGVGLVLCLDVITMGKPPRAGIATHALCVVCFIHVARVLLFLGILLDSQDSPLHIPPLTYSLCKCYGAHSQLPRANHTALPS